MYKDDTPNSVNLFKKVKDKQPEHEEEGGY
jgi:hypothetical protein